MMSLKQEVELTFEAALRDLGDIIELITYRSTGSTVYDPTTGTSSGGPTTIPNVRGLFTMFPVSEVDNVNVLRQDRKAIIAATDLGTVVPEPDDTISRANGETFTVKGIFGDSAQVAWVLQVRR